MENGPHVTHFRITHNGVTTPWLRTEQPWTDVLDRMARDDDRKLGGPKLPAIEVKK